MPITINGNGTVTGLAVGGLPDGTIDRDTLAANAKGSILQVKSSLKTDTWDSGDSTSWQDISGTDEAGSGSVWEVNITPTSASSKILVNWNLNLGPSAGHQTIKLVRDSTDILLGDSLNTYTRGSHHTYMTATDQYDIQNFSGQYLDSPSTTSATTYKLQIIQTSSSYQIYVNRPANTTDATWNGTAASTITVQEVAQ